MNVSIGNWLIIIGLILLAGGLLIKSGLFGWLGHLPGDIHVKREGFQFYFPLASMIVISIVVSLVLTIIRKFL